MTPDELPTIFEAREQSASVVRLPVHRQLVGTLRGMIIRGELDGGARLQEAALAKLLGVSRAPLREALKTLATEGLVELIPNRGARVAEIDAATYRGVRGVVIALELHAAEGACRHATEAEVYEIAECHFRMLKLAALNDLSGYFEINLLIHQKIVDLARNPVLSETYERLNKRIWRARYLTHMDLSDPSNPTLKPKDQHFEQSIGPHEDMLTALRRRDVAALRQAIHDHYESEPVEAWLARRQAARPHEAE